MILIEGKKVSEQILEEIKLDVERLKSEGKKDAASCRDISWK